MVFLVDQNVEKGKDQNIESVNLFSIKVIRTSKTKKNIKKSSKHQNIESLFKVHHYYNITTSKLTKITTMKVVDHYYENQNIEKNKKNIESLSFVWFL